MRPGRRGVTSSAVARAPVRGMSRSCGCQQPCYASASGCDPSTAARGGTPMTPTPSGLSPTPPPYDTGVLKIPVSAVLEGDCALKRAEAVWVQRPPRMRLAANRDWRHGRDGDQSLRCVAFTATGSSLQAHMRVRREQQTESTVLVHSITETEAHQHSTLGVAQSQTGVTAAPATDTASIVTLGTPSKRSRLDLRRPEIPIQKPSGTHLCILCASTVQSPHQRVQLLQCSVRPSLPLPGC